jgi:hypothetical protein
MILADGWTEGEGLGFEFVRGGEGAEGEGGGMGFEFVRGGRGGSMGLALL